MECQVCSDLVTFAVIVPKKVRLCPRMVDGARAVPDRLAQDSNHPSSQQSSTQVTWWLLDSLTDYGMPQATARS